MNDPQKQPEERVLSTLDQDGSRHWLKPRLSKGVYYRWRQLVAYLLIALYVSIPFIHVGGRPLVLLDIPGRRFIIFGLTFLPTDTILLAIFVVGGLLTLFLMTALVGRVWCGWACPYTVFMEYVFRPLERIFDHTIGKGGAPRKSGKRPYVLLKYISYFIISWLMANVLISYFVGIDALFHWIRQSPIQHPAPFIVMTVVTIAVMLMFSWFREQMCIIACPYGRFQSVLLDRQSLIVSYDAKRGEPRTRAGSARKRLEVLGQTPGDCVDCGLCTTTCPTGIDIRDGLQMECVNCTQCIDACDAIMTKLNRPTGLIRYSSQANDAGEKLGWFRPRVVVYPLLLAAIGTLFITLLVRKPSFDVVVLRPPGHAYMMTDNDHQVRNQINLKLTNRTRHPLNFAVEALEPANTELTVLSAPEIQGESTETFPVSVDIPATSFRDGRAFLRFKVVNLTDQSERELTFKLIGPEHVPQTAAQ